ncbi:MAG: hypothetical protein LQ342_000914 [Letrouitia transgressa]|nr:MAG: hypothetical protein LQ342_000914 [Letrouitia transgressa]
MFIRYLAEQAMNVVKSERKPRRNIQYKDLANAVARIDNLEFLSDVIPKTTTYREYKEKKSRIKRPHAPAQNGQTTLDGTRSLPSRPADMIHPTERAAEQGGVSSKPNPDRSNTKQPTVLITQPNGKFVFEHFEPNQGSRRDEVGDVIMD